MKALREKENSLESLADRELTIVKFRELVQKLQDQCQELQLQLQKESSNHDSMKMSIPEMLDFKVSANHLNIKLNLFMRKMIRNKKKYDAIKFFYFVILRNKRLFNFRITFLNIYLYFL